MFLEFWRACWMAADSGCWSWPWEMIRRKVVLIIVWTNLSDPLVLQLFCALQSGPCTSPVLRVQRVYRVLLLGLPWMGWAYGSSRRLLKDRLCDLDWLVYGRERRLAKVVLDHRRQTLLLIVCSFSQCNTTLTALSQRTRLQLWQIYRSSSLRASS